MLSKYKISKGKNQERRHVTSWCTIFCWFKLLENVLLISGLWSCSYSKGHKVMICLCSLWRFVELWRQNFFAIACVFHTHWLFVWKTTKERGPQSRAFLSSGHLIQFFCLAKRQKMRRKITRLGFNSINNKHRICPLKKVLSVLLPPPGNFVCEISQGTRVNLREKESSLKNDKWPLQPF